MALRDTLKAMSDQEKAAAEFEARKPQIMVDWKASLEWLLTEIEGWLYEYVEAGHMTLLRRAFTLREEHFGAYMVDGLDVRAGGAVVTVQPIARFVIGSPGRVDLFRQGYTGDDERYFMLRLGDERPDTWGLRNPKRDIRRVVGEIGPLTRATFEGAVDNLLIARS